MVLIATLFPPFQEPAVHDGQPDPPGDVRRVVQPAGVHPGRDRVVLPTVHPGRAAQQAAGTDGERGEREIQKAARKGSKTGSNYVTRWLMSLWKKFFRLLEDESLLDELLC